METRQVKSIEDAIALVEARQLRHVKVGVFDMDGVLRGKYMSKDKFLAALKKALDFAMLCWGGTRTINSMTMWSSLDGTRAIRTRRFEFSPTRVEAGKNRVFLGRVCREGRGVVSSRGPSKSH